MRFLVLGPLEVQVEGRGGLEPAALDRVEIARVLRERRASHSHLASLTGSGWSSSTGRASMARAA